MTKREIPSEFAGFVRDAGVRAFDRLSERTKEVAAPLRPMLRAWLKLSSQQKDELFEALIETTSAEETPAPKPKKKSTKKKKT